MKNRNGIKLLSEIKGQGKEITRGHFYYLSLRMWLSKGDPIVWTKPFGLLDRMEISDNGTELKADFRYDREYLIAGIFYGIEGMCIGGKRKFQIAPHLAYKETGVPGMIPKNALLTIEVRILEERF